MLYCTKHSGYYTNEVLGGEESGEEEGEESGEEEEEESGEEEEESGEEVGGEAVEVLVDLLQGADLLLQLGQTHPGAVLIPHPLGHRAKVRGQ